jgi:hypothetical protein
MWQPFANYSALKSFRALSCYWVHICSLGDTVSEFLSSTCLFIKISPSPLGNEEAVSLEIQSTSLVFQTGEWGGPGAVQGWDLGY